MENNTAKKATNCYNCSSNGLPECRCADTSEDWRDSLIHEIHGVASFFRDGDMDEANKAQARAISVVEEALTSQKSRALKAVESWSYDIEVYLGDKPEGFKAMRSEPKTRRVVDWDKAKDIISKL